MAMALAKKAFCVAARNSNSMQVFLVAAPTAEQSRTRLQDHGPLIGDATLQVGHELTNGEIQALNLQEDEIRQWL
jgi:hypothetical protein